MSRAPAKDDLTPDEANEQILLQAGRKAPYTQVGDWVALAVSAKVIDPIALALYVILAMHVNHERGDRDVWPSRGTLAILLGFAQARSVDKYLDQLEALGAIDAVRPELGLGSSGFRRNRYTVHQAPPEDYAGITTVKGWYKARKAEQEAARETTGEVKPAGQRVVRSSAPPPAGSAPQRTRGSAPQRTTVVRPSAHEQEEVTRRRELGGGAAGEQTAQPPDDAAPATPPRTVDLHDKSTWQCRKHLAEPPPEPGVYRPGCGPCGGVREWAEAKLAEQAAAAAAEAARLERECPWHDAANHVVDPDTGLPFDPVWVCDHRTSPEVVAAELAARARPADPGPVAARGRAEYRRRFPARTTQAPKRSRPGSRPAVSAASSAETVTP